MGFCGSTTKGASASGSLVDGPLANAMAFSSASRSGLSSAIVGSRSHSGISAADDSFINGFTCPGSFSTTGSGAGSKTGSGSASKTGSGADSESGWASTSRTGSESGSGVNSGISPSAAAAITSGASICRSGSVSWINSGMSSSPASVVTVACSAEGFDRSSRSATNPGCGSTTGMTTDAGAGSGAAGSGVASNSVASRPNSSFATFATNNAGIRSISAVAAELMADSTRLFATRGMPPLSSWMRSAVRPSNTCSKSLPASRKQCIR